MQQWTLPGHDESLFYPVAAIDCDWQVDGSVRGRPSLTTVASYSGTPRGAYYYKSQWYVVQGEIMYRFTEPSTSDTLFTDITGSDLVSFVPLRDHLLICCSAGLYIVNSSSAVKVAKPSTPAGISMAGVESFSALNSISVFGSATHTDLGGGRSRIVSTGDFSVEFTGATATNNLSGWFIVDYNKFVRGPNNWKIALQHSGITLAESENSFLLSIGGAGAVDKLVINGGAGHTFEFRRGVLPVARNRAEYKIASVVNDFESESVSFEQDTSSSYAFISARRFSFANAGTYNVYRKDSEGVYRLAVSGTVSGGGTLTDTCAEIDLGAEYREALYPVAGSVAIEHNRRAVIANNNQLYISAPGSFDFGSDSSDVLTFSREIVSLAIKNGILYTGSLQGWQAVLGEPGAWIVRDILLGDVSSGYVGDTLALAHSAYIPAAGFVDAVQQPLLRSYTSRRSIWITPTATYVKLGTRWSKWQFVCASYTLLGDDEYLHTSAGLQKLNASSRSAYSLSWTIQFDNPAQINFARLEGAGSGSMQISSLPSVSDNLPIDIDRCYHDLYAVTIAIDGSADCHIQRLLIELEGRQRKR